MKHFFLGFLVCLATTTAFGSRNKLRIVNGIEVQPGTFTEVVQISSQGARCSAIVIGPKVIITAGHCVTTDSIAKFTLGDKNYEAKMTRSPMYAQKGHDIALGVVSAKVEGTEPMSVGGKSAVGAELSILGFGVPGVDQPVDNKKRIGKTVSISFDDLEIKSRKPSGSGICFGDSGGPAYIMDGEKRKLLGIASKGDCVDTNYHARTDSNDSKEFLTSFASGQGVDICGVNITCDGTPPPPPAPTCSLTAIPNPIKIGQKIKISLVTANAEEATLDGQSATVPTYEKEFAPSEVGTYTSRASVKGPGGTGACEVTYVVDPDVTPPAPSCRLNAVPEEIKLGESIKFELLTIGSANEATINNKPVEIPVGTLIETPDKIGSFSAQGLVKGPGGEGQCIAYYEVKESAPQPSEYPELALVPLYCGDNTTISRVSRVCLCGLKKQDNRENLKLQNVLLVVYRTTIKEVLPIVHRKKMTGQDGDLVKYEEITTYSNSVVHAKDYLVLDSRKATIKYLPNSDGVLIPVGIEGRTEKGVYFNVDELSDKNLVF